MQLTYYNNTTDKRYLVKKLTQISKSGHSNPVTVHLLDDTNIVHPTFKMADVDLYMTANYCYVDDLHRYYYIDKITTSKGWSYLECTEDVLMTYARNIGELDTIVDRNEIDYNLYQVDNEMMVNNYTSFQRIEFAKGFDKNVQNFVMCVIGNTSTEPPSGGSSSDSSGGSSGDSSGDSSGGSSGTSGDSSGGSSGGSSGDDGGGSVNPGGIL